MVSCVRPTSLEPRYPYVVLRFMSERNVEIRRPIARLTIGFLVNVEIYRQTASGAGYECSACCTVNFVPAKRVSTTGRPVCRSSRGNRRKTAKPFLITVTTYSRPRFAHSVVRDPIAFQKTAYTPRFPRTDDRGSARGRVARRQRSNGISPGKKPPLPTTQKYAGIPRDTSQNTP